MPQQRDLSSPAIATPPRVFCKGCGYALVGLESTKCPECGRGFDLGNRRTFARRPPRSWVWRWGRRVLALGLLLMLAAGAGLFWLWWGWRAEQPTIAILREHSPHFVVRPIGPERLRWVLGDRWSYLTDRLEEAQLIGFGVAETEPLDFRSQAHLRRLDLYNCKLSHSKLSSLAGLPRLQTLVLIHLEIENPDLAFLEKLPALSTLSLRGPWVPKSAVEHLGRLGHLKVLDVHDTGMTDADLQQLQGLSALEELYLYENLISDAGLEHLQGLKSLRLLRIRGTPVTSSRVAKLKQAIPGLLVE